MKNYFFILFLLFSLIIRLPYSFAQIKTIDGNFNDWNISDLLASDYLNDALIDTCDFYQLYVYDDADSIFIRLVLSNNSNINLSSLGGFYGEIHVFISVDPSGTDSTDITGLSYGWWSNGYDFKFSKAWWENNFRWYKHNDPSHDWNWIDSNRICNTAFNSSYNDVEFSFPKAWIRYPNNIPDFPESGVGFIAILLAGNRGFSPYQTVDTLARKNSNFGGFIYTLNNPLPVELVSFNATYKGNNTVELRWSTTSEANNYGFEIERAIVNGLKQKYNWEKIGFVSGHGTSSSPKNYLFLDQNAYYGTYIYRLKQIDIDGHYKYSDYVQINTGKQPIPVILEQNYPNPFNPVTTIKFVVSENKHTTLKVYNSIGEEVATLFNDIVEANKVYNINFNAENLPSGFYFYKLSSGDLVKTNKMLLVK